MEYQDLIEAAGWWPRGMREWQALPTAERETLAFMATGCEVAAPTWKGPVDCVHTGCQIRRGELPKIAMTNAVLRGEACSGWLRFCKESRAGRVRLAEIFRAIRKTAKASGIYDPWELPGGWIVMVGAGLSE